MLLNCKTMPNARATSPDGYSEGGYTKADYCDTDTCTSKTLNYCTLMGAVARLHQL